MNFIKSIIPFYGIWFVNKIFPKKATDILKHSKNPISDEGYLEIEHYFLIMYSSISTGFALLGIVIFIDKYFFN